MGLFGKVAEATSGRVNANNCNDRFGEFYARLEETKIRESEHGTFAIVEFTPVHFIDQGNYSNDELLCDMVKFGKHHSMGQQFVARYVAALNNVKPGHKFSDDEAENFSKWEELSELAFGKRTLNESGDEFEYVHDDLYKGAVLHIKVIPDRQSGKKDANKKRDEEGNVITYTKVLVLGLVAPEDVPAETMEKYGETLHPNYRG